MTSPSHDDGSPSSTGDPDESSTAEHEPEPAREPEDELESGWWRLTMITAASLYAMAVVVLCAWVFIPQIILGNEAVAVRSGSMQPMLKVGDIVLNEPADAPTGLTPPSVITFTDGTGRLVTHRIVGTDGDGNYRTKGDANAARDRAPVAPEDIDGVGRWLVPAVGLPAVWTENGQTPMMALWAAITFAAAAIAFPSRRTVSPQTDNSPRGRAAGSVHEASSRSRSGTEPHGRFGPAGTRRWRTVAIAAAVTVLMLAVATVHATAATWTADTGSTANQFAAVPAFPTDQVHLRNGPTDSPTARQPLMPVSARPSTTSPQPDFSTDVAGSGQGRRIDVGTDVADTSVTATWHLNLLDGATTLPGDVVVDLWARTIDGLGNGTPKIHVQVWHGPDVSTLTLIDSEERQLNSSTFEQVTFDRLGTAGVTVPDGHDLYLTVQVTRRPIDLAYSSSPYPSRALVPGEIVLPAAN